MILKIKKEDFSWLYIETKCFEIQSTSDDFPPKPSGLESKDLSCKDLAYGDVKEQNLIIIERLPKVEKGSISSLLKTVIFTDNTVINCIGEFTGFVLNDKGQTVERL